MRGQLLVLIVLLAGGLGILGVASTGGPSFPDSPPVVLYMTEATRADHLGPCYGYDRETAPAICDLAADGVLFENAYASGSWTMMAVPSVVTGLSPAAVGLRDFDRRLPDNVTTVGERMRAAGYETQARPRLDSSTGLVRGFDQVRIPNRSAAPLFLWDFDRANAHAPYMAAPEYRLWDDVNDSLIDGRNAGSDWWGLRGSVSDEEMVALYDAEIREADSLFASRLDRLKDRGIYNESLIIYTSDHGESLGEDDRWGHAGIPTGPIAHVPLVVKFPDNWRAGTRIDTVVGHLDIVPTILHVAGVPVPDALPGTSLVRVVQDRGERAAVTARTPREHWRGVNGTATEMVRYPRESCTDPPGGQLRTDVCDLYRAGIARRADIGRTNLSAAQRERLRELGYID